MEFGFCFYNKEEQAYADIVLILVLMEFGFCLGKGIPVILSKLS